MDHPIVLRFVKAARNAMQPSPYLLLCLTSLFWSLNFIIGKVVGGVIPPATISLLRWLPPFFFFLAVHRGALCGQGQLFRRHWPLIMLLGATGYCLNSISVYEAVRYTSTINTSFINAFNPVGIAIAGLILFRYPLRPRQALGFAVSLAGVLCIVFKGDFQRLAQLEMNIGDLFMVGSIFFWSIHTTAYKRHSPKFTETGLFIMMMLAGLLATIPLVAVENVIMGFDWIGRVGWTQIAGILALNIFPSVLAYLFWNRALKVIEANKVAIFQYLIPVYTTLISVIFLGERLRAFHLAGGALIFIGLLLVTQRSKGPRPYAQGLPPDPRTGEDAANGVPPHKPLGMHVRDQKL
jgi:drug/metabolite transporter (DMT)-like permease